MREAFLLPQTRQLFGVIALAAITDQNPLKSAGISSLTSSLRWRFRT
jgi:hypothetical protein